MYNSYLQHWGIKGMKWGIRRYRNPDGTLTEAGKKRYLVTGDTTKKQYKKIASGAGRENRDRVQNQLAEAMRSNKKLQRNADEQAELKRDLYAEYATLYNRYARTHGVAEGFSDKLNPRSFDFQRDYRDPDPDIDAMIWDSNPTNNRFFEMLNKSDRLKTEADKEERRVCEQFVRQFNDAKVADIPNDGSPAAKKLILEYGGYTVTGQLRGFLTFTSNTMMEYWNTEAFDEYRNRRGSGDGGPFDI